MRVKRHAVSGFSSAERIGVVVHEGHNVYRVGFVGSLFRLIGFYEDNSKHDFIVMDAFLKKKQNLNAAERDRIAKVARIKANTSWEKVENDE